MVLEKVNLSGLRPTAREIGVSAPYLSDVTKVRRSIGPTIGAFFGFELVSIPVIQPPRKWKRKKEKHI
jgi:hypothetical protein